MTDLTDRARARATEEPDIAQAFAAISLAESTERAVELLGEQIARIAAALEQLITRTDPARVKQERKAREERIRLEREPGIGGNA